MALRIDVAALLLAATLCAAAAEPEFKPASADELLNKMRDEGSWSIVLMDTPGRAIRFEFGDLGKRVVELKWARDRGASIGEVGQRLDDIYKEDHGSFGAGKKSSGDAPGGASPAARRAQAFAEMHRAVEDLNAGKYSHARGHLALLDSAAKGLQGPEREDYAAASRNLRRAHAILAGDEALKRLIRAAEKGDYRRREALKKELRAYAKEMDVDLAPYISVAGEVWEAYQSDEALPEGEGGGLAAALRELEAAEKLVQGAFKRSQYIQAFERLRRLARGLSRRDREALGARLRAHAAMWNQAAANSLSFALMASLSEDPEVRGRKEQLLDQARWKGRQAARAHNLARRLLTSS